VIFQLYIKLYSFVLIVLFFVNPKHFICFLRFGEIGKILKYLGTFEAGTGRKLHQKPSFILIKNIRIVKLSPKVHFIPAGDFQRKPPKIGIALWHSKCRLSIEKMAKILQNSTSRESVCT